MSDIIKSLNFIRQEASTDYQDRVPLATRTNITEVGNAITTYIPTQNEFLELLVNKIGLTIIGSNSFDNPFAEFKGEQINFGDTIEDIFIELPKGVKFPKLVDGESLDPFKVTKAQLRVIYHKIDREMQYPVTIQDDQLRRAFKSAESMGRLVNNIVDSLYQALSYDEFVYVKSLLSNPAIYGKTVDLGDHESVRDMAKAVNEQLRILASNMKYKRTDYNALTVETWTPKENIAIIIRNDIKEAIDLTVLAGIFNMSKVELSQRIMEVDSFDTIEQVASIVDTRGIRIHDALRNAETQRNARGLYTNYFVNHWALVSFSKYRNAIMLKATHTPPTEA